MKKGVVLLGKLFFFLQNFKHCFYAFVGKKIESGPYYDKGGDEGGDRNILVRSRRFHTGRSSRCFRSTGY